MVQDEAKLIARCRNGDPDAWDEVFRQHYGPLTRFIYQVNAHLVADDVEDIVQETFLTMVKNLDTFQESSQLLTWLFRIAANKAHDFRERQQAQKRGGGQMTLSLQAEDPMTGLVLDPASTQASPAEALLRREAGLLMTQTLGELGDPCREIIELRYFADLSYEEIAITLSLNPKTVSSRLSKCLDKLEQAAREKMKEFSV